MVENEGWVSAATLHEALGRRGALPPAIKPTDPTFRLRGTAYPLVVDAGSNIALHRAIYAAQPGDVLVASVTGGPDFGYWGEIMSEAGLARGLAGLVLDGCVRDSEALSRIGLPIFSAGVSIRGTEKFHRVSGPVASVAFGDVVVEAGDLVVGDADGLVVVPAAEVDVTLKLGRERDAKEEGIIAALRAGGTTLDLFGFDA